MFALNDVYPEPLTPPRSSNSRGFRASAQERAAAGVPHAQDAAREAERLCDAIRDVKERVTYCSICSNTTDVDPCVYCSSETRDRRLICVVEEPQNVTAIEKTRDFKGVYHVLMGALSPLQGIGPDELKIKGLLDASRRGRTSTRSFSRRTRTSKAKRRRSTWRGCSSRSACGSRASRWACRSAATSNTPTK